MAELTLTRGPMKKQMKGCQRGGHIILLIKPRDEKPLTPKTFEEGKLKAHTQGNKMWQLYDEIGPILRSPVFIFTVSLGKTSYHFILKWKENAFCLSHWANDCSLTDPALNSGLSPSLLLGKKKVTNEEYRQHKWHDHTAEAVYHNGPQYNTVDISSPTRHWQERAGKENTAVWGLCLHFLFKQTRMAVVWICFILPQESFWQNVPLLWKITYNSFIFQQTEQALSSIQHAQCWLNH